MKHAIKPQRPAPPPPPLEVRRVPLRNAVRQYHLVPLPRAKLILPPPIRKVKSHNDVSGRHEQELTPISSCNGLRIMLASDDTEYKTNVDNEMQIPDNDNLIGIAVGVPEDKLRERHLTLRRCSDASSLQPERILDGIPPPESRFHDVWMRPVYTDDNLRRHHRHVQLNEKSSESSGATKSGSESAAERSSATSVSSNDATRSVVRKMISFSDAMSVVWGASKDVLRPAVDHKQPTESKTGRSRQPSDKGITEQVRVKQQPKRIKNSKKEARQEKQGEPDKKFSRLVGALAAHTHDQHTAEATHRVVQKKSSILSFVSHHSNKHHSVSRQPSFFDATIQDIRQLDSDEIALQYQVYLANRMKTNTASDSFPNIKRISQRHLDEFYAQIERDNYKVEGEECLCCGKPVGMCTMRVWGANCL